MKKVLITANMAGFIKAFLQNDIVLFKNMGYRVFCAACDNVSSEDKYEEYIKGLGVEFVNIEFNSKKPISIENFKAFVTLKKLIKQERFDIVFCHTPIVGLLSRLAVKKYRKNGTKSIYMSHGLACSKYSSKKSWKFYFILERFLSRFTDVIITINHEDFNLVKHKMKCKNVEYIPGVGFDFKRYNSVNIDRNKYRKSIGVKNDDFMILSIGEISKRKNHKSVIEALALCNDTNNVYVIAGKDLNNDKLKNELFELAREKNVRLIFLGFRYDIPELIHCADIGAIPSIREGLGMAGVQSLAGGLPLIGSNVQGIKDYIIDGYTGYLCSPFDYVEISKKITQLKMEIKNKNYKDNCILTSKKFTREESNKTRIMLFNKYFNML